MSTWMKKHKKSMTRITENSIEEFAIELLENLVTNRFMVRYCPDGETSNGKATNRFY